MKTVALVSVLVAALTAGVAGKSFLARPPTLQTKTHPMNKDQLFDLAKAVLSEDLQLKEYPCPQDTLEYKWTACFAADSDPGRIKYEFTQAIAPIAAPRVSWSSRFGVLSGRYHTYEREGLYVGLSYFPRDATWKTSGSPSGYGVFAQHKALVQLIVDED